MHNIEPILIKITFLYLLVMNLLAIILTIRDKRLARNNGWRIPEKSLLLTGVLGGAFGEWITMLIIRHNTKHLKFMILLPLFFTAHAILLGILVICLFS